MSVPNWKVTAEYMPGFAEYDVAVWMTEDRPGPEARWRCVASVRMASLEGWLDPPARIRSILRRLGTNPDQHRTRAQLEAWMAESHTT